MRMQELNDLTQDEIKLQLDDAKEEMYNLRFQHAMHQLDNPLLVRDARRKIARLRTILHEYDLGIRSDKKATVENAK